MDLTQETILTFLLKRDGKAKNSELLSKFKGLLNCSDLAEKKQNRELFKQFVNNIAVVKEIDGEKYTVIKKRYAHLLKETQTVTDQNAEFCEGLDVSPGSLPVQSRHCEAEGRESSDSTERNVSSHSDPNSNNYSCNKDPSAVEFALQRSINAAKVSTETSNIRSITSFNEHQVTISKDSDTKESTSGIRCVDVTHNLTSIAPQKPFMLPLRLPPPQPGHFRSEVPEHNAKGTPSGSVNKDQNLDQSPRTKRRLFEEVLTPTSPHPRRSLKNAKPIDEPKYSANVPLESIEHEWLVKSATGHWSQVHGLLLRDAELALKKDFMSGFTALHWAAKCGNGEMIRTILELCVRGQADFDVNIRSYGGYTALHIAAIHNRESVMISLIRDYGASTNIRDNNGKKPYHYLHKGVSAEVRELLGGPQALNQEPAHERNGDDHLTEMSKSFSTIGRLFQPYGVGPKKKHKQRSGIQSVSEEPEEEKEDSVPRSKSISEMFKPGGLMSH